VAAIGILLLDVLAAAHAQNIVHRDLKPDNVFVTRAGQLKVLDFGIARLREAAIESSTGTLQGSLLGTPGFMAPEQALGRWNEVDGRTDIWAVGATLFTVLTSRFAHEADSVQEQLVMAATRQATRVAAASPDTPPWLAEIIDRAMAFDPAVRFPDARAMKDALLAACAGVDLPPLSIPDKPISLVRTPQFPDGVTRPGESQTIAGVQARAHSSPHERSRGRARSAWIAASVLAAFGIAFVLSSLTGKTDPSGEPAGTVRSLGSGASVAAPSKTSDPRTAPVVTAPEPAAQRPAAPEPAAAPPRATHVPTVTPAARVTPLPPPKASATVDIRKPTKATPKKPPEGEKPVAAENPFDTRH
jgi:serine/threonine-protein kinase